VKDEEQLNNQEVHTACHAYVADKETWDFAGSATSEPCGARDNNQNSSIYHTPENYNYVRGADKWYCEVHTVVTWYGIPRWRDFNLLRAGQPGQVQDKSLHGFCLS
jgi:hypothetical protein